MSTSRPSNPYRASALRYATANLIFFLINAKFFNVSHNKKSGPGRVRFFYWGLDGESVHFVGFGINTPLLAGQTAVVVVAPLGVGLGGSEEFGSFVGH